MQNSPLFLHAPQVFVQGPSLYAFKGLAGKLGPIGVHAAMLMVLAGTSYSGFGGFKGTIMTPEVCACVSWNKL
jgi:cytochrome c biogenesis protein